MFYVSDLLTAAPKEWKTPLQKLVYQTLELLRMDFERVETDEAITMEDCVAINERLKIHMVKTLFLCNRQQTAYYLFITCGEKPFQAKEFSAALHVSRVSFAPAEKMLSMLGVTIGAATVFSALVDCAQAVKIVLDKDVLEEEWMGVSDGTTTGYMKVRTQQILREFLPYTRHVPVVV